MTTLRVLIVDDEEPARDLLRAWLAKWREVQIAGEAGDGATAIARIRELRPDLVFLDVQMPDMNGFDVVGALAPSEQPMVVFVTAYDQYAVRAFEISACDYLLKPFDEDRLANTMARVLGRAGSPATDGGAELRRLVAHLRTVPPDQVVVRVDGRHIFLKPDEIEWIEASGKDVRVHVAGTSIVVRETMNGLERRLDPSRFVRVHRSTIVNRLHVREMQSWFKGDYVLILRSGARVVSGRTYRMVMEQLVKGTRRGAP